VLGHVHRELDELPHRGAGLALPGNGSVLATHTARRALYEKAGATVMDIVRRYYEQDDAGVLPRAIATREAFDNAMALDIAMGGRPTPCCTAGRRPEPSWTTRWRTSRSAASWSPACARSPPTVTT
jgi:hypothetical protein